jgi:hypothetical protein
MQEFFQAALYRIIVSPEYHFKLEVAQKEVPTVRVFAIQEIGGPASSNDLIRP